MFIKFRSLLAAVFVLLVLGNEASACGVCAFAGFDSTMPPIFYWCALAVAWLLTTSVICAKYSVKSTMILRVTATAIIIIAGILGATTMFGPITLLPLALPAMITTLLAIINVGSFKQNSKARITIVSIGLVFMILSGIGLIWRKNILSTRTDAQMYIQWNGSMTGRALMAKFKQNEAASINEYRYIIDNGKGSAVADAARRLGIIGDPKIDKTRLKLSLPKVEDSYDIKVVQEAIDSLSASEADSSSNRNKK